MPKRVIDFDAMWGSDKLASCAAWAQVEYAWLYGLADASGCFEVTNLRVIWGRVAAIRANFTIERLEQVFAEFEDKGLLFVWEHEGKRYAHWTGSDVPGRLPPPSWRVRMEKYAPPVPKQRLAEYMGRFARGRAAMGSGGFRGELERVEEKQKGNLKFENSDLKEEPFTQGRETNLKLEIPDLREEGAVHNQIGQVKLEISDLKRENVVEGLQSGIKGGVEEDQGEDWDLNLGLDWKLKGKWEKGEERGAAGGPGAREEGLEREKQTVQNNFFDSQSNSKSNSQSKSNATAISRENTKTNEFIKSSATANSNSSHSGKADADSNATANAKALNRENSNANSNSGRPANSGTMNGGERNSQWSADSAENEAPGNTSAGSGRRNSGLTHIADVDWGFVTAAGETYGAPSGQQRVFGMSAKELAVQRELRVGAGPVCWPGRVRPEVLERIRLRDLARAKARSGSG